MLFLTDFGDLAVLLPLATTILLWLLLSGARGAAAWWLAALIVCIGGIGLLKIYLAACVPSGDLRSPSGHSGFSMLVYGALAASLAIRAEARWRRLLAVGAGLLIVAGIAISRLVLGAHTPIEDVIGLLIGGASLGLFVAGSGLRLQTLNLRPLLLAAALIVILLHGRELHAEEMLHAMGIYLAKTGVVCR
jgi:membrane-associated phospholipid phosphatase